MAQRWLNPDELFRKENNKKEKKMAPKEINGGKDKKKT